MRSFVVVLMLLVAPVLLLPACHEDWDVLGHELQLTADEVGQALDRWSVALDEGHQTPTWCTSSCLEQGAGRFAAKLDTWTSNIEHDLDAWAATVEADADALGRDIEASAHQMAQGIEVSIEQLGLELERFFEALGRSLGDAADDFVHWLESLD